ncbi:uncharacterized protein PAC_03265 [Phialocephala subalpina]|uniref:Uncharacterized protein n=1 Tax=Phialocephala subalpina TaxID=576137 RepID=A0A1L7WKT7_9HELO|nr:uncharacterized protein PAC_03265 [Phialocephala subalpina]
MTSKLPPSTHAIARIAIRGLALLTSSAVLTIATYLSIAFHRINVFSVSGAGIAFLTDFFEIITSLDFSCAQPVLIIIIDLVAACLGIWGMSFGIFDLHYQVPVISKELSWQKIEKAETAVLAVVVVMLAVWVCVDCCKGKRRRKERDESIAVPLGDVGASEGNTAHLDSRRYIVR